LLYSESKMGNRKIDLILYILSMASLIYFNRTFDYKVKTSLLKEYVCCYV